MDRKTLIAVVICLLLFMAYPFLLRWAGLDHYMSPQTRPNATAARDTSARATRATALAESTQATGAEGMAAPAAPALAPERLIMVETPLYRALFSTRGAKVVSVELKRYATATGPAHQKGGRLARPGEAWPEADRVVLDGGPTFALDLGSGAPRRHVDQLTYEVAESLDAAGQRRMLHFVGRTPEGATVQQTYRIRPDDYAIDLDVAIAGVPLNWRVDDYSLTT